MLFGVDNLINAFVAIGQKLRISRYTHTLPPPFFLSLSLQSHTKFLYSTQVSFRIFTNTNAWYRKHSFYWIQDLIKHFNNIIAEWELSEIFIRIHFSRESEWVRVREGGGEGAQERKRDRAKIRRSRTRSNKLQNTVANTFSM